MGSLSGENASSIIVRCPHGHSLIAQGLLWIKALGSIGTTHLNHDEAIGPTKLVEG